MESIILNILSLLLIFGLGTTELLIVFVAIGGVVAAIVYSANKKPLNTNSMDGQANQIQQNPYQGNQQTFVSFGNQKSMLVAFLLAFFFGPLGLLYSSVAGGIVLILIGIPVGIFTLGFGLIFVWIASIIWALIATSGSNNEMQSGARVNINTIYAPPVVNQASYSEPVYQSHQNEPVYTTSQYQQSQTTPNPVFQQTVVSFGIQKSVLVAFLLAFFFGPLGLLYSSITGGVILMIIGIPIGILTLGFGLIFIWIASVIWAIIATNSVNNKMQSGGALNINTQYRTPETNRQPVNRPNYTVYDDTPIIIQPQTSPQSKTPPQPQTPPQQQEEPQTPPQQQEEPQPHIESKPQYQQRPQLDQYRQSPTQTQRQLVPAPPRYLQQLSEPISTGNIFKRFMIGIASILLILILVVGIKFIWGMDFSKLNFNPLKIFTKEANKNDGTLDKTDNSFSDASSIINSGNDFYMVNVEAVKSQSEAENKVSFLKNGGYSAGYLWIPNYPSLSGMKSYAVYIGPFSTQYDCEVATDEYREKNPDAYGLLVSKERRRVEIYGIGNVKEIPNWRENEYTPDNSQIDKPPIIDSENSKNNQNLYVEKEIIDNKEPALKKNDGKLVITPQNEGGPGQVSFSKNEKTLFCFEQKSQKGKIILNGITYILNKCDSEGTSSDGSYNLSGKGIVISALNCKYYNEGGDCFHGKCPEVVITLNGVSSIIKNVIIMDCLSFSMEE